ncbi:uncharacterized protein A1O5_05179 [Cladophialophora psammophila CBS 110553]|uniref:Uncharacterized protein n=1 Tax=Cladophialophora psammophila CBS 110553 TaxID=1182543 RepID=W9WT68_9EURO|nr:uncharacterized protein A1O5_05179 [Cladophialophora psammophila CBS 110553]EXJ71372.1 hypothetical protein A1O5_05179 [Cladophialophora psammophila CBS 110553]
MKPFSVSTITEVVGAPEMVLSIKATLNSTKIYTILPKELKRMSHIRPRVEALALGPSSSPSRRKASTACFSCKIRKSKVTCLLGMLDRVLLTFASSSVFCGQPLRRKIHWERAETESALQKEMVQRLLQLIYSGDDEIRKRLRDDSQIQVLAERLGLDEPELAATSSASSHAEQHEPWFLFQARTTDREQFEDDVSQKGELTRRRAILLEGTPEAAPEAGPSNILTSPAGSYDDQWYLPILSDATLQTLRPTDPRDQYRIFCLREHETPSIELISIFGDFPLLSTETDTGQGLLVQRQQLVNLDIPEYLVQPMLFEGERCPMAAAYTDFRDYGRRQLAAGFPVEVVLGSSQVDLALYFRERRPDDPHTPATWACEYMRLLKNFDIYVALAWVSTYAHFMRWTIAPSAETYALLPDAMKPTPLQRLVRHHPGVDLPIFPEMRDGLIQDMRDYIMAIQTLGCSVNWAHGLEAAITTDPETGTMTLSDTFASHICSLSHWSISQKFADVFPEMRGYYHVVEQDTIPVSEVDVEAFLARRRARKES